MDIQKQTELKKLACKVRMGIMELTYFAGSGHPGGSLSIADIITYLYNDVLNINPKSPRMITRDRFVLSKGHAAPALYSILALKGFFDTSELKNLRKLHSILQGHPNMLETPGVDMSTGSLGQGISAACGMALASKTFNENYKVYCIVGDGELQEGEVWEAAMFASHNKLDNLIVIVDNNGLQIDGKTDDICSLGCIDNKFDSFGWHCQSIDAHDFNQIEHAFSNIGTSELKPNVIIQKSIKGKGVSFMEDICSWHGVAPNESQYYEAINELNILLRSLGE